MGTGIDAYDQGARMGISAQSTISTGTSKVHIERAFRVVAASSMRFARGISENTKFRSERAAAGDRFAHKHGVTENTPSQSTSQTLDLSTPAASPPASKHSGASPTLPDFSL
jgi:hypothetical protein